MADTGRRPEWPSAGIRPFRRIVLPSCNGPVLKVRFWDSSSLREKAGNEGLACIRGAKDDVVLAAPRASRTSFLKRNLEDEMKRYADQKFVASKLGAARPADSLPHREMFYCWRGGLPGRSGRYHFPPPNVLSRVKAGRSESSGGLPRTSSEASCIQAGLYGDRSPTSCHRQDRWS